MPEIGLLNYGAGNFASVRNALVHLGIQPVEITAPGDMDSVSHIILPGVGSFPAAMQKLHDLDLVEALNLQVLHNKKPFLGICVGMQILAQTGHEFQETAGLGWIPGEVKKIEAEELDLPVPHIGWNNLEVSRSNSLLLHLPDSPSFYYVHSYSFRLSDSSHDVASCQYGCPITSVVQKENIYGVQFHPEKSQRDGLQLLKNFCCL